MEIQELPGITRFVPKILLALTVTICHEVYKKIAYWLNDMGERHLFVDVGHALHPEVLMHLFLPPENYRLQSAYENNLIIKMVFVSRLSGFSFLFLRQTFYFDLTPCNISVIMVVFQFEFINSYLSLFYIGFYLKDMERLKEVTAFCRINVSSSLLCVYQSVLSDRLSFPLFTDASHSTDLPPVLTEH